MYSNIEYQHYLQDEKIKLTRLLSVLGILLYGAFTIVDYWALNSAFKITVPIRVGVIMLMIATLLFTYNSSFIKNYSLTLVTNFVASAGGVIVMIYLANPSDHAYFSYFAGLMIVLLAMYSWTYLAPIVSSVFSIVVLIAYVSIEILARNTLDVAPLITNVFFLTSAIIFGLLAQIQRDNYLRQNFILQKSLQEAYEKKSVEAANSQHLANHDPLTDLPNRRYMMELLGNSLELAKKRNKLLIIMFMDLNGFKQINDTHGHNAGDEILKITAKRLEIAIRKGDYVSRLGGDEYLIGLLVENKNIDKVEEMANKYIDLVSRPMNVEGTQLSVGASIGVSAYPINGNNVESLIEIADHRMYHSKNRKSKSATFENVEVTPKKSKISVVPS